ncbi:MAG: magnesium transporter CorA family protein [Candidatus Hodarchaeales archaeon]
MIIRNLKTGEILDNLKEKYEGTIWIDISYPLELHPEENADLEELSAFTNGEIDDFQDCLDLNERSRFDDDEDYLFIILRVPAEHPVVEERRITVPLGIFWNFERRWIATVHTGYISLPLGHRKSKRLSRVELDPFNFLCQLVDSVIWTYELALDDLDDDLDAHEKEVTRGAKQQIINKMFNLSKRTAYLHTALRSNLRAINQAKKHPGFIISDEWEERWEDIENDAHQQVEMIQLYKELLNSSMNTHASSISNELADVMKLMTSISLILMIPTLVASIYGMNVQLPLMTDPLAFWLLIILSSLMSFIAIVILKRLDWL